MLFSVSIGASENMVPEPACYTKASRLFNVVVVLRMPAFALFQPSTISAPMMSSMVHNRVEQVADYYAEC